MDSHEENRRLLEIEKLRAEIGSLKHRWWITPLIQIIPACLLLAATGYITVTTGIIDAKRDRLAAETERLTIEKARLEDAKGKIESEVATLRKQLEETKAELSVHTADKEAVTAIQRLFPTSMIHYHYQYGGYIVGLETIRLKLLGDWIVNPSNTLPALKEVSKLSNVAVLQINGLPIGEEEAKELRTLRVARLVFEDVPLDETVMRQLAKNRALVGIAFTNGSVSDQTIAAFREERPDVEIAPGGFKPDSIKPKQ
jgi:hypothetical protein